MPCLRRRHQLVDARPSDTSGVSLKVGAHKARWGAWMARRTPQQYQRYCEDVQRGQPGCPDWRLLPELQRQATSDP